MGGIDNPLETLLSLGVANGEITQSTKDSILNDLKSYEKSLKDLNILEKEVKKYAKC